ncbi:hypothetical protein DSAG12_00825 [Promethearchaeum syntrophicum]|uniref:Transmembrane protein n=1 Tax=Promethearchaeum syntrophicum TaxID=2594042 RepID=A0A5B9D7F0_9ARCH|nr:hypothetical protein [Candidatus Prometheoarchaeum syntrophicum]
MGLFYDILLLQFFGLITVKICNFVKDRFDLIDQICDIFLKTGIYIRELCHFAVSKLLLVPIDWSDLNFNNKKGRRNIDFDLTPEYVERLSFLKEFLIVTAPIWIGTYLTYKLSDWYRIADGMIFRILIIIGFIIILCFIRPTLADYGGIFTAIMEKPFHFLKQLIFLGASYLIYIYNYDYFYNKLPHYHYLFDFVLLLSLEGILELIMITIGFIIRKLGSLSNNDLIMSRRVSRMVRRDSINEMFPSRRRRKKEKAQMDYLRSRFDRLPDDDETVAEEFAEAMIQNNKMMIDLKNNGIDSE